MIQSGFVKLEGMERSEEPAAACSLALGQPNKPPEGIRKRLPLRQPPGPTAIPDPGKDLHIAEWPPSDGQHAYGIPRLLSC